MSRTIELTGVVLPGRGRSGGHLEPFAETLKELTGQTLIAGTLNIVLDEPLQLKDERGLKFDAGHRMLWPGKLNGLDVWLYRWIGAPLHVVEVLANCRLRDTLLLSDHSKVRVTVGADSVDHVSRLQNASWRLFWAGRHKVYYRSGVLSQAFITCAKLACFITGAVQSGDPRSMLNEIKRIAKRAPVTSVLLNKLGVLRSKLNRYPFQRVPLTGITDEAEHSAQQVLNVLAYTKTSGSSYSAKKFPAGYHTIEINGSQILGQRNPAQRFENLPYDFRGKTVLDVGTNQGGMLFQIANDISWGVGIDYDSKLINAAHKISRVSGRKNLDFYVFNLEKDPLGLLEDLLPGKLDMVFLLSVCMWIKNWREVLAYCADHTEAMLFESNGSPGQQREQEEELKRHFPSIQQIADVSADDSLQSHRRTFLCTK